MSDGDNPSSPATKRSTSAFAFPSTGGAVTETLTALSPYEPFTELVLAPGETRSLTRTPSFEDRTKPRGSIAAVTTPAEEAAGPEDPALLVLLSGPLLVKETVVSRPVVGRCRFLPINLLGGDWPCLYLAHRVVVETGQRPGLMRARRGARLSLRGGASPGARRLDLRLFYL